MIIGVLAMQGAYKDHINVLHKIGVDSIEVKYKEDIKNIDGIIIPGGESTAIGKLLRSLDIYDTLYKKIVEGMPVWGTCAGMILLAKKIHNQDNTHLSAMNIEVVRNGYGRQLGSFNICSKMKYVGEDVPMIFIRAPYITKVGDSVEILSTIDGKIVSAKENNMLVTSFHPELTNDIRLHKYFINMVKSFKQ